MNIYNRMKTEEIQVVINDNNKEITRLYSASKELYELENRFREVLRCGRWIGDNIDLGSYHKSIRLEIGKLTHEILYMNEIINNRSNILDESQAT